MRQDLNETATMQRITITLDDELMEDFESFAESRGYANRSEAIRDLIRERLDTEQLTSKSKGECIASLTYVYNHHERELARRLTSTHHEHHDISVSTMHVHLDHDNCMETVILRGTVKRVQEFSNSVMAQPGVRHGNLHMLPVKTTAATHRHGDTATSERHLHVKPFS
jgi:CopG family nickel-responsive transcriptional regulator